MARQKKKEQQPIFNLYNLFFQTAGTINRHIYYLNSSKFFAGIIMILLNVGSKFITIQFSKSTEEYMKYTVSKQLLVFAMAWMGTRDIYTALGLTAIFTILSEYLFNEDSAFCILSEDFRDYHSTLIENDTKQTDKITDDEIKKAKKNKKKRELVLHSNNKVLTKRQNFFFDQI